MLISGLGRGRAQQDGAADDHQQTKDFESGDRFPKSKNADNGDEGRTHPRPDGVHNTDFQGLQGLGHQGKATQIKDYDPDGGKQATPSKGEFQAKGAAQFQRDG